MYLKLINDKDLLLKYFFTNNILYNHNETDLKLFIQFLIKLTSKKALEYLKNEKHYD